MRGIMGFDQSSGAMAVGGGLRLGQRLRRAHTLAACCAPHAGPPTDKPPDPRMRWADTSRQFRVRNLACTAL